MASVHLIDQAFERYQPEERIAVGGTSEVYRARDRTDGKTVALKVLLPQYANNAELRAAIEREAELQRGLSHPNLVRLIESGRQGSTTYLVLEWVAGLTLSELIQQHQPAALGPAVASYVGVRVLEALHAIHGARGDDGRPRGIVHRDIKPSNVMITPDGRVKVGDFGIARQEDHSGTRTGTIKGSLAYLAPEQATQSSIDARTDLYLTGLLLFELLTGVRYLEGEREVELLRAAENPIPRKPSEFGASRAWDRVLGRALARFPEERFKSAERFRHALEELGAAADWSSLGLAHHFDSIALRLSPAPPTPRRPRWPLAAAGILLAAGIIAGLRSTPEPPAAPPLPPARSSLPSSSTSASSEEPEVELPTPPESLETPRRRSRLKAAKAAKAVKAVKPAKASPKPAPAVATPPEDPRASLAEAIDRLRSRGIALLDLDAELRQRVTECSEDCESLIAALDETRIDRALIERKLARIQETIPEDIDPEVKKISGLALQALFDGRLNEANAYLNRLENTL